MGKANHLKPTRTGGTIRITTRRKPARELITRPDRNGRRTGEAMTANLELTGRTPAFFVAASRGRGANIAGPVGFPRPGLVGQGAPRQGRRLSMAASPVTLQLRTTEGSW
jgi:hypothetical protein